MEPPSSGPNHGQGCAGPGPSADAALASSFRPSRAARRPCTVWTPTVRNLYRRKPWLSRSIANLPADTFWQDLADAALQQGVG